MWDLVVFTVLFSAELYIAAYKTTFTSSDRVIFIWTVDKSVSQMRKKTCNKKEKTNKLKEIKHNTNCIKI